MRDADRRGLICCLATFAVAIFVLATVVGAVTATSEHAQSPPQRVLCALFSLRYEAPYLLPWLAYHRLLGFDRIILYHDDTSGMFSSDLLESHSTLLQLLQRKASQPDSWLIMKSMAALGIKKQREQVRDCNKMAIALGAAWATNFDIDEALAVGPIHAPAGRVEFNLGGTPSPLPLSAIPNSNVLRSLDAKAIVAIPRSEYMLTYANNGSELPPHDLELEFERYTARLRGLQPSVPLHFAVGRRRASATWRRSSCGARARASSTRARRTTNFMACRSSTSKAPSSGGTRRVRWASANTIRRGRRSTSRSAAACR